jgi:hypothetical protein
MLGRKWIMFLFTTGLALVGLAALLALVSGRLSRRSQADHWPFE